MGPHNTPQQRAAASAALKRWHREVRPHAAKCGAKARSTGEPCRNVGLENGRCYWHGGVTPKGDDYHKPRWPKRTAPDAEEKLNRKLRDREKASKKRAARLANMTPLQRKRHEAWQRSHKPGPPGPRKMARRERLESIAIAERERRGPPPPTDEAKRLLDQIAKLEALRDQLLSNPPETIFD